MRLVDIYFPDSPLSYQLLLSRLGKIPFHPFVLIQKDQKIKAGGHFPAKLGDGRFRAFRAVRKTSLYGTLPQACARSLTPVSQREMSKAAWRTALTSPSHEKPNG